MNEDPNFVEGQMHDPQPEATPASETPKSKPAESGATLKSAWKSVENIGQTLGEALQGRGNVVMVRVNDETLAHLDMLVEAELARSRSEAAALLISEGAKANTQLFDRIRQITDQISALRNKLKVSVQDEDVKFSQKQEGEQ